MKPFEIADLKAFRQKHKLRQRQLAELLPVNLRTLQEWESAREKGQPPPFLWRALAHLESELGQVKPGKDR
jgi:DNA-binding transcriptional regulator YiaG